MKKTYKPCFLFRFVKAKPVDSGGGISYSEWNQLIKRLRLCFFFEVFLKKSFQPHVKI